MTGRFYALAWRVLPYAACGSGSALAMALALAQLIERAAR